MALDKGKRFGTATIDQRGWTRTIDLPGIANSTITGNDGTDIGSEKTGT